MTEKILPQDQKEKFRSQPRKNFKSFIPQIKILKKIECQNNFTFN